ncbi:MAG: DUF1730 domain-containing protein [Bacillota bacterium]|nr:DUF1730 domain-containing protein [Bacillota bacterium]
MLYEVMKKAGLSLYKLLRFEDASKYLTEDINSFKSVIVFAVPYYCGIEGGNISLYARGEDYHVVLKRRAQLVIDELQADVNVNFSIYTDNSPFKEVKLAAASGLGLIGKNGLLITKDYGSFVFIGEILTDMLFDEYDSLSEILKCENCGLCIEKCPGGALSGHNFDKTLCVSGVTQKKGELSKTETDLIKNSLTIWGCDICQIVCPHNKDIFETDLIEFKGNRIKNIFESDVKFLTNKTFKEKYKNRAFTWRGVEPFKRNTKINFEAK